MKTYQRFEKFIFPEYIVEHYHVLADNYYYSYGEAEEYLCSKCGMIIRYDSFDGEIMFSQNGRYLNISVFTFDDRFLCARYKNII